MNKLKQLLKDKKYLEAKKHVMGSRDNLEQNLDILLESIEKSANKWPNFMVGPIIFTD